MTRVIRQATMFAFFAGSLWPNGPLLRNTSVLGHRVVSEIRELIGLLGKNIDPTSKSIAFRWGLC